MMACTSAEKTCTTKGYLLACIAWRCYMYSFLLFFSEQNLSKAVNISFHYPHINILKDGTEPMSYKDEKVRSYDPSNVLTGQIHPHCSNITVTVLNQKLSIKLQSACINLKSFVCISSLLGIGCALQMTPQGIYFLMQHLVAKMCLMLCLVAYFVTQMVHHCIPFISAAFCQQGGLACKHKTIFTVHFNCRASFRQKTFKDIHNNSR